MTEVTESFFASLPARAPAVLRSPVSGTIRIDLSTGARTDHWRVELAPGQARVSRSPEPADAIWYSSADLFERLVTGRTQGIAAVLRNESTFSGDLTLFLLFRHFFPDPPGTRDPREVAREQAGRSR
ncbi:SCP2 sterol-binding domain-containing protein [Micromonospora sp. NPDC050686]|uniref:SCP2 sterol-binding domain-containing protein n=1 Tax=Micromonospora sp. NPDC050686 TaxID=3154631 RepID=UPI0033D10613